MNRQLSDVTHLIIDEVHERDIETELLLLLIKHLLKSNKNIKIILMSATIDMEDYETFFSTDNQTDQTPKKLLVDGRTFPVAEKYIDHIEKELETTFNDFNPVKAEPCFDSSQEGLHFFRKALVLTPSKTDPGCRMDHFTTK